MADAAFFSRRLKKPGGKAGTIIYPPASADGKREAEEPSRLSLELLVTFLSREK